LKKSAISFRHFRKAQKLQKDTSAMIEEDEWSKEQEANRKPGQKHPTPSPVRV
jgi:hypothetical protein